MATTPIYGKNPSKIFFSPEPAGRFPRNLAGIFFVSSGAEFRPLSQGDLGDIFPNFEKQFPIKFFFFFFFIFIQSPHTLTHKLHADNLLSLHLIFLQFNGNSMCNSLFVFKLTENAFNVCLENLVVYRTKFPNLKGPRTPSQNCQKNPCLVFSIRDSIIVCSNDDPGVILTYFTARSNLVTLVFLWEKVKTVDF